MRITNTKYLSEQAQEKIDALVNDLIDCIDVDLLSNAERIVYLKTIIGHSIPRKESVSVSKLKAPESVKWLLDQSEQKIQGLINDRIQRYTTDTDVVGNTGS
jgi:hypothetical protein